MVNDKRLMNILDQVALVRGAYLNFAPRPVLPWRPDAPDGSRGEDGSDDVRAGPRVAVNKCQQMTRWQTERAPNGALLDSKWSRGAQIRTAGLLVPNQALCRAELHPVARTEGIRTED